MSQELDLLVARGEHARTMWYRHTDLPLVHGRFMEAVDGSVDEYVRRRLVLGEVEEQRPLVLLVSPARSASSSLLTAMSLSAVPTQLSHEELTTLASLHIYQPIKYLLRRGSGVLDSQSHEVEFPTSDRIVIPQRAPGRLANRPVVQKEVCGPYAPLEVFDPVSLMLRAGQSKDRIHAVYLFRRPDHCWESWQRTFGSYTSRSLFVSAYRAIHQQYCTFRESLRSVHAVVSEALGPGVQRDLLARLMPAIGIPYSPEAVSWDSSPYFRESTVTRPVTPMRFRIGEFAKHRRRGRLSYRTHDPCAISRGDRQYLSRNGLWDIYESVVADMGQRFDIAL